MSDDQKSQPNTTKEWLRNEVDNFLIAHPEVTGESFGWHSIKDAGLVRRLRNGGDVTTKKLDEIIAFIYNFNQEIGDHHGKAKENRA